MQVDEAQPAGTLGEVQGALLPRVPARSMDQRLVAPARGEREGSITQYANGNDARSLPSFKTRDASVSKYCCAGALPKCQKVTWSVWVWKQIS